MDVLIFIFIIILSYLLGSIPFGYLITKIFTKKDIRDYGSNNIGATNVFRVTGKTFGFICLALDILKGFIPVVLIANLYYGAFANLVPFMYLKIILGLVTISGHIWPIYLKFKGGKGVATALGVFLGIDAFAVLIAVGIWIVIVAVFRVVSLASIVAAISLPFIEAFKGETVLTFFAVIVVTVVIFRHRENIGRLITKNENKI